MSVIRDYGKRKDLLCESDLCYADFRDSFVRASINKIKKYLNTHF